MSQRTRLAKTSTTSVISPSKSKKKSIATRMKKSSPNKRHPESTSSILTQPRQKRLSSLTAAALVHYCTSVLSPSRKVKRPTKSPPKNDKSPLRKRKPSNVSSRSDPKNTPTNVHTRIRREASSRASAMIMQQNEIERSRYNYTLTAKQSTSVIRRQRTKSGNSNKNDTPTAQPPSEPFKFNIPPVPPRPVPVPSVTTKSAESSASSKYPSLTEALLAEHDRLHETLPTHHSIKHENLVKWTQELALCGRLSPHDISLDSTDETTSSQSPKPQAKAKEISTSSTADSIISTESVTNPTTTPAFPFPSAGYPLDLRSLYPLMPCWQYLGWPYPSSASFIPPSSPKTSIKKTPSFNSQPKPIVPVHSRHQNALFISKNDALTFHLHTHHHHHIHNSDSSSLPKSSSSAKTTTIPLSSEKPLRSLTHHKEQPVQTKTVVPLSVNNVVRKEQPPMPPATDNHALNLTTSSKTNGNQENGAIRRTTRRKSSPVKRGVNSGTKLQSTSTTVVSEKIVTPSIPPITSPRKITDNHSTAIAPSALDNLKPDGHSPMAEQKVLRRSPKRRSVSAVAANSTSLVVVTRQSLRGNRTISASCVPLRSKSLRNRKRSHSSTSVTPLSSSKKKKPNVSHYWTLSGRSRQQLVSLHADKPPVFRQCYSSIQHVTEKDVIKSNDCVILRPEDGRQNGATPYVAKVKWFWQEPTSSEILMSLIWYYHPEHAELPARVKERFLPNELLASKYWDCVNAACIEDKCYVLNPNEYNRFCLREVSPPLFDHSESVGQLKSLLNKNTSTVHHRPLPAKTVDNQNIFFCRCVYDYRVKRISKNPSLTNPSTINPTSTTVST